MAILGVWVFLMSEVPLYPLLEFEPYSFFENAPDTLHQVPLSSEYSTYKTVKARFWPCLKIKAVKTF